MFLCYSFRWKGSEIKAIPCLQPSPSHSQVWFTERRKVSRTGSKWDKQHGRMH